MGTRLFVAGLAWRTTEASLVQHVASAGEVTWLRLVTDRETGRHKGYAFVEMATPDQAERAVATLDGVELDERPLTVQEATPRSDPGFDLMPVGRGSRPIPIRPSRAYAVDPAAARTRRW